LMMLPFWQQKYRQRSPNRRQTLTNYLNTSIKVKDHDTKRMARYAM
jgi:DNA-dependent RNA polymerase auxiliary subunit epsilon